MKKFNNQYIKTLEIFKKNGTQYIRYLLLILISNLLFYLFQDDVNSKGKEFIPPQGTVKIKINSQLNFEPIQGDRIHLYNANKLFIGEAFFAEKHSEDSSSFFIHPEKLVQFMDNSQIFYGLPAQIKLTKAKAKEDHHEIIF
jgi:hypothetical protein